MQREPTARRERIRAGRQAIGALALLAALGASAAHDVKITGPGENTAKPKPDVAATPAAAPGASAASDVKATGPGEDAAKPDSDAATTPAAAPDLSAEFLSDPDNIAAGKALWEKQCRHCHGRAAYPGKAPKLKPRKYKPDFVYDRVTNGFRKMPAWKEVFNDDERRAIVAYVLSREFSP